MTIEFRECMTTAEAAKALDTTETKLGNLLRKYPHIAPLRTFGAALVWTAEDITAVIEHQRRVKAGLCWKCGTDIGEAPEDDNEGEHDPDPVIT